MTNCQRPMLLGDLPGRLETRAAAKHFETRLRQKTNEILVPAWVASMQAAGFQPRHTNPLCACNNTYLTIENPWQCMAAEDI